MVKGSHHTKESKAKIGKNPKCGFQKGNTVNSINYVGKKFGKLTITDQYRSGSKTMALCLCDCGQYKSIIAHRVSGGYTKSCGCLRAERPTNYWTGKNHSKETRAKMSNSQKGHFVSKETAAKISAANTGRTHSEEAKLNMSMAQKERFENNPELRIERSKILKAWHKNNDNPMKGKTHTEEARAKISASMIGENNINYVPRIEKPCAICGKPVEILSTHAAEDAACSDTCRNTLTYTKFLGENNPNWRGGSCEDPYCDIWFDKEYKSDIKDRDGKCMNPKCKHITDVLHIHHIDYDKMNCHPWNLITLCNSCHSLANFNRENHTLYYQDLMTEFYNYEYEQQLSLLEAVNQ